MAVQSKPETCYWIVKYKTQWKHLCDPFPRGVFCTVSGDLDERIPGWFLNPETGFLPLPNWKSCFKATSIHIYRKVTNNFFKSFYIYMANTLPCCMNLESSSLSICKRCTLHFSLSCPLPLDEHGIWKGTNLVPLNANIILKDLKKEEKQIGNRCGICMNIHKQSDDFWRPRQWPLVWGGKKKMKKAQPSMAVLNTGFALFLKVLMW